MHALCPVWVFQYAIMFDMYLSIATVTDTLPLCHKCVVMFAVSSSSYICAPKNPLVAKIVPLPQGVTLFGRGILFVGRGGCVI